MAPHLALHLLGPPQLYLDNARVVADRRKALALLAYLARNDGKHARESMSALFWPDYNQSKAFTNLRHTLWEVQQAIGEGWIIADREFIQLEHRNIWLDVARFEALLADSHTQGAPSLRVPLFVEAVKLYRNHFLTGFSLADSPAFSEWAFAESENLRRQLVEALTALSEDYCVLNQADEAIPHARRLSTLDPLNESAHRLLMRVYVQSGQHSAALQQYQTCEQILRKELGVDPQPETRALYKQIRKGEIKPVQVDVPEKTKAPQHNLPIQLSTFIGREREVERIKQRLGTNRLVTLTGSGGVGKTRLSIQVASELLGEYPDGVWIVELAPLTDPALVPQAVGTVLDVMPQGNASALQVLTDYLQSKKLLLVVDNCEHLIEACAELCEALLRACPNLRILTSSREALGIEGENAYRVPSLSLADPSSGLQTIEHAEAVQLFVERARAVLPEYSLSEINAPTIARICQRLDGIALAIELASSRVKMFKVDQIAARLDDAFRLLTGGSRTALPRQRTLRGTIDWSYNLLSREERAFLCTLSVFAGGWTLEAAEAVFENQDTFDLLTHLVDKSLVAVDREQGHEARYYLLETIRQYAREKLADRGEGDQVRARHLEYFLTLAQKAEPQLYGAGQIEWLQKLEKEHENMNVALKWSLQGNIIAGQQLAGALWWSWQLSGHLSEGKEWLRKMLAASSGDETLIRAKLLSAAGYLNQSTEFQVESISLYRKLGDEAGAAFPLANSADFAEHDRATKQLNESLDLFERVGNKWGMRFVIGNMGNFARLRRDFDQAQKFYEESLRICQEIGDQEGTGWTLHLMGLLAEEQDDDTGAMELYEQALEIEKTVKSKLVIADISRRLGLVSVRSGAYEKGNFLVEEALEISRKTGDRAGVAWSLRYLGLSARLQGDYTKAKPLYAESLQVSYRMEDWESVATCLIHIGNFMLRQGSVEKFVRLLGMAERIEPDVRTDFLRSFRTETEQSIESARAELGDETYTAAYKAGHKMSLDEAVAYALKELQ